MAKYIDAERLKKLISQAEKDFIEKSETKGYTTLEYRHKAEGLCIALQFIDSLLNEEAEENGNKTLSAKYEEKLQHWKHDIELKKKL